MTMLFADSLKMMRLPGRREHSAPDRTVRIEPLLLGRQHFDRDVNEAIVQMTDHHASLPSHRGVDSMPRELVAKDSVFGVVRAAADDVARVKVAHKDGDIARFEPLFNLFAQKHTDVTKPDVSRGIALTPSVF